MDCGVYVLLPFSDRVSVAGWYATENSYLPARSRSLHKISNSEQSCVVFATGIVGRLRILSTSSVASFLKKPGVSHKNAERWNSFPSKLLYRQCVIAQAAALLAYGTYHSSEI